MNPTRLHEAVAAVAPIFGVSFDNSTVPPGVRIDYRPQATPEQMVAAEAAVLAYDWSSEAESAWKIGQVRQEAGARLLQSAGAIEVGSRANANATWFERNNVAEALWAAIQLVCASANVPVPTVEQIAAKIAADRTAAGQTFLFPSAQDAAERGIRRLMENDILVLIQTILQSGGADPIEV